MARSSSDPVRLSPAEARALLVGHHGLRAVTLPPGAAGVRALLDRLRCIQLDPLDRIGTNADLVALARVDGLRRGDVYTHLLPGHAFEHFAKERCLLPATALPYYRQLADRAAWWRITDKHREVPEAIVAAVLDQIRAHGPLTPADLTDHGSVDPLDWSGWRGTGRLATLAVEVLWWRSDVVVCGRSGRGKLYDVPERALPAHLDAPPEDFLGWAVVERAWAAGLLTEAIGPQWSMIRPARDGIVDALVRDGRLVRVTIDGARRTYLAPPEVLDATWPDDDGRMRILGPLDPLLWDRKLVQHAFGFDYIWEVYKPAAERKWGYYVCPLLHRGALVGRIEARVEGGAIVVDQRWVEDGVKLDARAYAAMLRRHEAALTT